ncbi:hypothetical protein [Paenibacillus alkalitolerans]|uniref:hypothetical protein n=1 Tax=Paenibacillus alkalitolerans TaxID=2799335 RepID=UPI0018F382FC|nr:hypothetical protein [Paenibacillus alkalitolerans]
MVKTLIHHKFLKNRYQGLKVGDYIPNYHLGSDIYLHNLIKDHLIIVVLSSSCQACFSALQTIDDYSKKDAEFNMVVLFDTSKEQFKQVQEYFVGRLEFFHVTQRQLKDIFKTISIPYGYCLNSGGQILTSFPFSTTEGFLRIIRPIKDDLVNDEVTFKMD